jgi:hypothetical protein
MAPRAPGHRFGPHDIASASHGKYSKTSAGVHYQADSGGTAKPLKFGLTGTHSGVRSAIMAHHKAQGGGAIKFGANVNPDNATGGKGDARTKKSLNTSQEMPVSDFNDFFKSHPKAGKKSGAPHSGEAAQNQQARPGNRAEPRAHGKAGSGNPVVGGAVRGGLKTGKPNNLDREMGHRPHANPSVVQGKAPVAKGFPVRDSETMKLVEYVGDSTTADDAA